MYSVGLATLLTINQVDIVGHSTKLNIVLQPCQAAIFQFQLGEKQNKTPLFKIWAENCTMYEQCGTLQKVNCRRRWSGKHLHLFSVNVLSTTRAKKRICGYLRAFAVILGSANPCLPAEMWSARRRRRSCGHLATPRHALGVLIEHKHKIQARKLLHVTIPNFCHR